MRRLREAATAEDKIRLYAQALADLALRGTGRLRPDLTDEQAADLVWSMNSLEYFQLLADAGYTPEQYAHLLTDVWTRTLLTPPPSRQR